MQKETKTYKIVKRKFNDVWALIFYTIITITTLIVYKTAASQQNSENLKCFPNKNHFIWSFVYLLGYIVVLFGTLLFCPRFVMHVGFISLPIILLSSSLLYPNIYTIGFNVLVAAMSLFLYFAIYRKNIKYSAEIVKASMGILIRYMLPNIAVLIVITGLYTAIEVYLFKQCLMFRNYTYIAYALLLFHTFFTYFISEYFFRIYVSTCVSLDLPCPYKTEIRYIPFQGIKNALYSLGSICFGALLIAIASIFRWFIRGQTNENSGLGTIIFRFLLGFLSEALRNIILFVNEWTFCFMALHGKSYIESTKGAYSSVTNGFYKIFVNSLCVLPIVNVFMIIFVVIYVTIFDKIGMLDEMLKTPNFLSTVAMGFHLFFILYFLSSMIDTATKAFLFTHDYAPDTVNEKYPKVKLALEKQRGKI